MIEAVLQYFGGFYGKLELIATIVSLICVYMVVTQNIWTWFWGAIGVILYGFIFLEYKLYSDMLLQWGFFLPAQAVGFWWWKTKGPTANDDLPVKTLSSSKWLYTVLTIVFCTIVLGSVMKYQTDASFPYADALTTFMSIVAQIYMIKKIWESWILWVTMDMIAIVIYFEKGLYVTSCLYVFFLCLASYGLFVWYKEIDKPRKFALRSKAS